MGTTNTQTCELCHYCFVTSRSRKSIWDWCREDDARADRRNAFADFFCFLFITPLGLLSFYMCLKGALYFQTEVNSPLEMWSLLGLGFCLFVAYSTWIVLCVKYHLYVWKRWRNRHWNVRIIEQPDNRTPTKASDVVIEMQSDPLITQVVNKQPNGVPSVSANTSTPLLEQTYHVLFRS